MDFLVRSKKVISVCLLYVSSRFTNTRSCHRRCSVKKVFLEIPQNSQENTCARVSFLINFIKIEALAQVFSYEFCEISKNTLFYRTPPVAYRTPLHSFLILMDTLNGKRFASYALVTVNQNAYYQRDLRTQHFG